MTRDAFLLWMFHFLTDYRARIRDSTINKDALLILDGHTSRENPLTLTLLRRANVHVLVIPSHTSHVLQMFDTVIAAPLKRDFSKYFESFLSQIEHEDDIDSMAGKVRLAAIQSIVSPWERNCNPYTAKKASKTTGTYPPNADNAKKSIFVHELNEEEQQRYQKRMERIQRRINISGQLITTEEKIQNLAETIGKVKNMNIFAIYNMLVKRISLKL